MNIQRRRKAVVHAPARTRAAWVLGACLHLLGACSGSPPALPVLARLASALPPAAARPSSSGSDSARDAKPDDAAVGLVSEYCVNRLLSPIDTLASEASAPREMRSESEATESKLTPELFLARANDSVRRLRGVLAAGAHPVKLETFVAMLPDPIDSGLVYQFETSLQALRLAFELPVAPAKALFRDRAFLPWDDREQPAALRPASEKCRTLLPGLLLFRNSNLSDPVVSLVFLVGETPTSGVRSAPLLNTLRLAAHIDDTSGQKHEALRIIGPSFSGSAYSLRLTLEKFALESGAPQRFEIISGSASGSDVAVLLDTRVQPSAAGLTLHYAATTVPESSVECAYLWFLNRRLGVPTKATAGAGARDPEVLQGVASLSESGTEFGSAAGGSDRNRAACGLESELQLSFPVHASFLRDAYEDMDRRADEQQREASIARQTALSPALEEVRQPLDIEANPSPKTRAAVDVLLSNVLGEISRRGIQHVSIRATDVGDAIFLARKIRDVAPDVRLAFFEPDDLLLHPDYRSDLLGSLVISPYPFLGVSDFRDFSHGMFTGFANAGAEGVFNAVLAQRGAAADMLADYAVGSHADKASAVSLLVWTSAIARTGLVPLDMKPPLDCQHTIFGPHDSARIEAVCKSGPQRGSDAWSAYNRVPEQNFPIDPGLELPRLWNFLYLALLLAFVVDIARQNAGAHCLASDAMPESFEGGDERAADRAIGRTKWRLYAAIRSFLFVLAFSYMGVAYALAMVARNWLLPAALSGLVTLLLAGLAVARCWRALRYFVQDARAFARYVDMPMLPRLLDVKAWLEGFQQGRISSSGAAVLRVAPLPAAGVGERMTLSLGLMAPVSRAQAARVSFAQLRIVVLCTVVLALGFTLALIMEAYVEADVWHSRLARAVPTLTLNVLRNVPLLNGVSQATPALLCMCAVYVWAAGRMARLGLVHSLSRVSPPDGETDLVSTPMRLVLYPKGSASEQDDGYTRAERDLLNAIWRPITGRYYTFACLAVIAVPIVLFMLKPLSTLEGVWGTRLLAGGLGLSAALVGVTQVQLAQYWLCLQRLLERTALHPFGAAFRRLPEFARATLDRQMSRPANDLLRWAACARQYQVLVARMEQAVGALTGERLQRVRERAALIHGCARRALRMEHAPDASGAEAIALSEQVISAASEIRMLMEPGVELTQARAVHALAVGDDALARAARACIVPPGDDELQPMAAETPEPTAAQSYTTQLRPQAHSALWLGASGESEGLNARPHWLREAEVFVVTVVTLLLHRHVRQFRHFMSMLVSTAFLMLLAVTSYPFQPYRLLLTCIWVVVSSVAAAGLYIYVQLSRDPLINAIGGKSERPSVFTSGFALRIVTWAVVPLLSAAAAQYPDFANKLFQLVSPFLRALR